MRLQLLLSRGRTAHVVWDSAPAFVETQHHRDAVGRFSPTDVTGHQEVGGQLGSNHGGSYRDPQTGKVRYVKYYASEAQARSEVAAGLVYEAVGARTLHPRLVKRDGGKVGVATDWVEGLSKAGHLGDQQHEDLARQFVAAALTKNWDAVGLEQDNLLRGPDSRLVSVDLGGSFRHRAQGASKPFEGDVDEVSTLLKPGNSAHALFRHLRPELVQSVVRELPHTLSDERIESALYGAHDPGPLAAALRQRRDGLVSLHRYGYSSPGDVQIDHVGVTVPLS